MRKLWHWLFGHYLTISTNTYYGFQKIRCQRCSYSQTKVYYKLLNPTP